MTKYILTFLTFILISCSTKTDNKNSVYFVIKQSDKITNDTGDIPPPPPPPTLFYGLHNFILVDTNRIFYHDNNVFRTCGTGIDFSKPPRLFITADSITEINITDLPTFLLKHSPDSNYAKKWFSANIASPTDTIRNRAFKIIADYFKSKNIKLYGIRLYTEEESYAINSKLNKTPYDPLTATFKNGFDMDYSILLDTLKKRK